MVEIKEEESIERSSQKEETDIASSSSSLVSDPKDKFRLAFNKRAFGFGDDGRPDLVNDTRGKKTTTELTDAEWELIISTLSQWDQPEDPVAQTLFRRNHKEGY